MLVTIGTSTVALAQQGNNIYVFDSHSRNSDGYIVDNGHAVLLHCTDIQSAVSYFTNVYGHVPFNIFPVNFSIRSQKRSTTALHNCTDEVQSEVSKKR